MKNILLFAVLLVLGSRVSFAQFSGSAGENATTGPGPSDMERVKRLPTAAETKDDGSSTFIEASLLMNVKADEYVAVFGAMAEGLTPEEASTKLDTTLTAFKASLKTMGIADDDIFVDFVSENRIYAYHVQDTTAKEELAGFEIKKNVSVHFKDKLLVDQLAIAAARAQIFDLIKVDYVVKDREAIQARLQEQTMALVRRKADQYQTALGVKLPAPTQIVADKPSVYYPVEQYDSYTAAESESLNLPFDRDRTTVQNARKSRTTYFNPLSGNGFDVVLNPTIIEPVVQFTTYIKVKYAEPKKPKK